MPARVAILGASGIGKHHGNWWTLEGAEVCAFAGTSPESVMRTRSALEQLFGFSGNAYTGVAALLQQEKPGIVDVCTPPPCHAEHVRAALEAGCHVLCEKPFVYDRALPKETLLAQAEALLDLAAEQGCRLSVCTQYSAGARIFRRLREAHAGTAPITAYHGRLEAPAKGRGPDPVRIWVDLAPHLISVLLELLPEAVVQWDTLHTRFSGYEAIAAFDVLTGDKTVVCELYTRNRTEPPPNIRQFKLNDYLFDVQGITGADGVFSARIVTPGTTVDEPDMMRLLIRDFLAETPTVSGDAALRNLEIMLEILDRTRQNANIDL